jgi:hypothetical protein
MKMVAKLLILFFLGAMFVSLFYMSHMDMQMGMSDCPYMSHEEVVCPMSVADHIGAWKSVFLSVVPTLTLLVAAATVVLFATKAPNLLLRIIHFSSPPARMRERVYTFFYRSLQELFARGILNPKLY